MKGTRHSRAGGNPAVVVLALLLSGCTVKSIALRTAGSLIEKGTEAFYEETDLRLARESMGSQIKIVEALLKSDPKNRSLLLAASQGYGAYAFLFLETEDPERAKIFYERGRNYGLKALAGRLASSRASGKWVPADLLAEPDLVGFRKALSGLGAKDAAAAFWTAYSWGGLANLSRDNPDAIAWLPKVEALMMKANELSPGFFYGGADIFLGAYYGSRPKMFGGDLQKSKLYFDRAVKAADGKFLMAQVLYAEHYAVPAQDKELFKQLLEKALKAPDELKEQGLSNAAARIRAKKLMEKIDEIF